MHLVAKAAEEGDAERKSVDVLVEVQDVRFNGGERTSHRRPQADVRHSPILLPQHLRFNGIHSPARHQFQRFVQLHVRRREPDGPPQPVPRHDHTLQGIPVPQHLVRLFHLPLFQSLSNLRGRYGS